MKKKEVIILLSLFIICIISAASIYFIGNKSGNYVEIISNGETMYVFPIGEDHEVMVECDEGYNKVVIEDGKVYVSMADCNDKICMKKGRISTINDSIICLPHKLVVRVVDKKTN